MRDNCLNTLIYFLFNDKPCTILHLAMIDLATLLRDRGLVLPPKIIFQFDNCGENKVSMRAWRNCRTNLVSLPVTEIIFFSE